MDSISNSMVLIENEARLFLIVLTVAYNQL